MDDVHLVVFVNGAGKYIQSNLGPGKLYIPVYEDLRICNKFIKQLKMDHRDNAFLICSFTNLEAIDEMIREEFTESVKMIVKEVEKNT